LERLKREAFSGGLAKASRSELEEYSAALCYSQAFSVFGASEFPQVCETVRTHLLRSHIETLQNHVVELHDHITNLNDSNEKIQRWVVALAVAALIAAAVQTTVAIRGELREEAKTQQGSPQPQQSAPPLAAPAQTAPLSSGPAKKKTP
jgi:hypothetical protein